MLNKLSNNYQKKCKWYDVCPMKYYYKQGLIDKKWIEQYCFGNNEKCKRYQMEERGEPHPDNMLPDGTIDKALN
jgi:hypothetical protein